MQKRSWYGKSDTEAGVVRVGVSVATQLNINKIIFCAIKIQAIGA